MSIEHVRHLSDLLNEDVDILDDRVVDGLYRLLMGLKREVIDTEAGLAGAVERYGHLPSNQELDGFIKMTAGEVIEMYRSHLGNAKQELEQVRTILLALAGGNLSHAFEEIEAVLDARRYEREAWVEAQRRKSALKKQPQTAAPSFEPSASTSKEPQHFDPTLAYLHRISGELGSKRATMLKKELIHYLRTDWDERALGEISDKKLDVIAGLLRPVEAQKGRAKPMGKPGA